MGDAAEIISRRCLVDLGRADECKRSGFIGYRLDASLRISRTMGRSTRRFRGGKNAERTRARVAAHDRPAALPCKTRKRRAARSESAAPARRQVTRSQALPSRGSVAAKSGARRSWTKILPRRAVPRRRSGARETCRLSNRSLNRHKPDRAARKTGTMLSPARSSGEAADRKQEN